MRTLTVQYGTILLYSFYIRPSVPKPITKDLSSMEIHVVTTYSCYLGEGPVWDDQRNAILWVDIMRGNIHEFSHTEHHHRVIESNVMVGAIALCDNGDLIAALKTGLCYIRRNTGAIKMLVHPEMHLQGNRFNDGKCDGAGRFWIGSMALSEEGTAGSLYRVEKDFTYKRVLQDVALSNGLGWAPDNRTFYHIDTPTRQVSAFDFNIESGNLSNKRTIINFPETEGYPDGMTIDAEGMLWIAHWGGWQVSRWNPATGKKIFHFRLPVANVSSCTFGGNNFRDLYITSARKGLSENDLQTQPLAGSLFVIPNCGFQGSAPHRFRPASIV